jgi:hypothetical protein
LRSYGSYWDRMKRLWGERRLDEITATEVEALLRTLVASAVRRRNHCGGRNTGENFIAAARALYNRASPMASSMPPRTGSRNHVGWPPPAGH